MTAPVSLHYKLILFTTEEWLRKHWPQERIDDELGELYFIVPYCDKGCEEFLKTDINFKENTYEGYNDCRIIYEVIVGTPVRVESMLRVVARREATTAPIIETE